MYILVKQDREILLQMQENQPVCKRINADFVGVYLDYDSYVNRPYVWILFVLWHIHLTDV